MAGGETGGEVNDCESEVCDVDDLLRGRRCVYEYDEYELVAEFSRWSRGRCDANCVVYSQFEGLGFGLPLLYSVPCPGGGICWYEGCG